MRLIDADNFSKVFNSKIFNKLQNEYLNSTADDKTKDVADFVTAEIMTDFNDLIDNAPTIVAYTEEQIKELVELNRKLSGVRPQGEWIPVSERLPTEDNDYIVTYIFSGEKEVGKSWFNTKYGFIYEKVIAWQPLPEPYKKGGTE